MLDLRFWVPGTPVPKGNHDAFPIARGKCDECRKTGRPCRRRNCFGGTIVGTAVTDSAGKELEAWQEMVRVQAISARNAAAQRAVSKPGAVSLKLVFLIERPAGHWTDSGALTRSGREMPFPTSRPDWDKLTRAVCDGLIPAIAEDDSQFVLGSVALEYAPWKVKAGCSVRARRYVSRDSWVAAELDYHSISTVSPQGAMF